MLRALVVQINNFLFLSTKQRNFSYSRERYLISIDDMLLENRTAHYLVIYRIGTHLHDKYLLIILLREMGICRTKLSNPIQM